MLSQPKLIVTQPSLAGAGITIAGTTAIANGVHLNIKKDVPGNIFCFPDCSPL